MNERYMVNSSEENFEKSCSSVWATVTSQSEPQKKPMDHKKTHLKFA